MPLIWLLLLIFYVKIPNTGGPNTQDEIYWQILEPDSGSLKVDKNKEDKNEADQEKKGIKIDREEYDPLKCPYNHTYGIWKNSTKYIMSNSPVMIMLPMGEIIEWNQEAWKNDFNELLEQEADLDRKIDRKLEDTTVPKESRTCYVCASQNSKTETLESCYEDVTIFSTIGNFLKHCKTNKKHAENVDKFLFRSSSIYRKHKI